MYIFLLSVAFFLIFRFPQIIIAFWDLFGFRMFSKTFSGFRSTLQTFSCFPWLKTAFLRFPGLGLSTFPPFIVQPSSKIHVTGLHTQNAYNHSSTSSPLFLLLSAHEYVHFDWELQLGHSMCTKCIHTWASNQRISEEELLGWVYAFWVCKPVFCC